MLKTHLKLALRNLLKRKGYSSLNILGLAIGITCCLLIFQYVAYERSYDSFHSNAGQVVRLRLDAWQKGKLAWQSATVYPAIAPAMKRDFPEIENYCRLYDANFLLSNDENHTKFKETKGYYADASVLEMFGISLVRGNPAQALDGPGKIILSETTAKKYFGDADPLGKRLTARDGSPVSLEVTGVFKEYPGNSHLILHHLISYATLGQQISQRGDSTRPTETSWGWYDFYSYLQLKPGTDWHQLQAKLPAFCERYINSQEWRKKNNARNALALMPLTDIHLYSNYNQEAEVNGNGKAVGFLFLISFFIIIIAWVNYTNLATARSLERAKEVGVRKVLGAARMDLVLQFLTESFVLNLLSFLIALGAAVLLTPAFNNLIGSQGTSFSLPLDYSLAFLGLFLAGTLVSGLYPAFVLSGYHPITVLKGLFKNTTRGLILRKGLIIGQFTVSVILIAGTILVYQQVQYMRQQQLGANISQTLVLEGAGSQQDSSYKNIFEPFKTSLLQQTSVRSVSASSSVMGQENYWTSRVNRVGEIDKNAVTLFHLAIDYDFIPSFDLKLAAGRNFSKNFSTDNKMVLINENAANLLGFKNAADAINGKIRDGRDTLTIIGVVADFHQQGLQKSIDPTLILLQPDARNYYSVKIATDHVPQTIAAIEKDWNHYFPDDPFHYFFLDEFFNEQYKADIRFGQVFGLFAFLAILIACFGLLGLSAYNVLQRTKEIGVRKVLGASVRQLIFLLSKEFLYLVLVSLLIAVPLTWWVMNNWLEDFAYRISIQWWVFVIAGVVAVLIALLTVGYQALKAALANPVKSLRTE